MVTGAPSASIRPVTAASSRHRTIANSVAPFVIDSPMLRQQQQEGKLPSTELLMKAIPARRLGEGGDVAAVCSFLSSDGAGYVNGQLIGVNGGAVV